MARTPSASAHRKVLDATLELVAERGVDATSMDAIARKSGVSKATIYKHWADKDALLLDIMADVNGCAPGPASIQAIPGPTWWPYCPTGRRRKRRYASESCRTSWPTPPAMRPSGPPGETW